MDQKYIFLFLCSLLYLFGSCTIFDSSEDGTSNPDLGRIVVKESIDSLKPGFTSIEVKHYLGNPDDERVRTSWIRLGSVYFEGDTYTTGDTIAMVFHYDSDVYVE